MAINVTGKLQLDGSGWEHTLRVAQSSVNHLGDDALGALKGKIAEAFTVGAIEEFVRRTVENVSKIKELSEQYSISTEQVQKYSRAAERVGLTFENVGAAFDKLGRIRKEAGEKEGTALHELEKYGLTLQDIRDPLLQNIDLVEKMRNKMEELARTAEGRRELNDFFGKGGARLGAVFDEADKAGAIRLVTPEQIELIDKSKKDFEDMYRIAQAMASGPISDIAKALTGATPKDKIEGLKSTFWDVMKNNPFTSPYVGMGDISVEAARQTSVGGKILNSGIGRALFGDGPASADNPIAHTGGEVLGPENRGADIFKYKPDPNLLAELERSEARLEGAGAAHEQKRLALVKERLELNRKIENETGDAQLKDRIRLNDVNAQIKDMSVKHGMFGLKTGDSLTKTGNFLGTSANSIVSIGERTNHLLTLIAHNTQPRVNTAGNIVGTTSFGSN